jgi:hypothetical protein
MNHSLWPCTKEKRYNTALFKVQYVAYFISVFLSNV